MSQHFDVLIVGAGSAGSVLASRLSEDAACLVGVVEAGGMPTDPDIGDPLKWPALQGRVYDWAYRTVPQQYTARRVHEWPRGRIVGGSSCLHAMAHVRGHPRDFDAWAEAAGEGWSFDGLRDGFDRSERLTGQRAGLNGHEGDGPLDVFLPDDEVSPVVRAYMAAGTALGVPPLPDHNSGELVGTSPNCLTIRGGRRVSVADAYLTPEVLARPNLTLLTGHEIEHLELDGHRAVAAICVAGGSTERISAGRIVFSAGAVSSPLILMRSGIGDPQVLREAGIACVSDRKSVGRNLQDHLLALGNVYRSKRPVPPSRLQHSESLMYLDSADFSRTSGQPDIVLACVVAPSAAEGLEAPAYGQTYTLLCGVTHPTSRGNIRPSGPGRGDQPTIDPHYLETELDRLTFRKALRAARTVGHHPALDDWRDVEVQPGPEVQSDGEIDAFIARAASTHHHPAGTCRMGMDAEAVVDPELRVKGFHNLFVVDASVFPSLPSGPINAAVVAVAETWAARQR